MKVLLNWMQLLAGLFFSGQALALGCVSVENGNIEHNSNLSSIIYLQGSVVDDEKIIWRSPVINLDIKCSSWMTGEKVYLYPLPFRDEEKIPSGVALGVIINGKDLGVLRWGGDAFVDRIYTGIHMNGLLPVEKRISYQVYMIKKGDIYPNGADSITIFQLDGEGGFSGTRRKNLHEVLTGFSKIASVSCGKASFSGGAVSPTFDTSSVLSGNASAESSRTILVTCTAPSAVLSQISSVNGTLLVSGAASSVNKNNFSTTQPGLEFGLTVDGNSVYPGSGIRVNIPTGSSGIAQKKLTLGFKPVLASLSLNKPEKFFSGTGDINSAYMDFSFEVDEIEQKK